MAKNVDEITEDIRKLPDVEKLRLVDTILSDDKPDPEIDRIWPMNPGNDGRRTKPARCQRSPMSPLWPNTAARNLLACRIRDSEVVYG
jgi:hypothetical protein